MQPCHVAHASLHHACTFAALGVCSHHEGQLIKLARCMPCSAAADLLCIAQHGLSPLHNKWDPSAGIPLATHLTTSSMSAHPDSSDTMQVVVCRACLKGPCKRLPDAGNIFLQMGTPARVLTGTR